MRAVDVLTNIKNHNFDIGNYPLSQREAPIVMVALKEEQIREDAIAKEREKIFGGKE